MNRSIVIGRLTSDPELKYTQSGHAVTKFTIAIDRPRYKDKEKETDFIPVVTWDKLAELCAQYLAKGRLAAVSGRLQIRQYDDKEGRKVKVADIVADEVRFLDRADGQTSPHKQQPAPQQMQSVPRHNDDPFADGGQTIDISDENLPF